MDFPQFEPKDPRFAEKVARSFARQKFMSVVGATISAIAPGSVRVDMPYNDDVTQQHGFLHGGMVAAIADSACGYAALTLIPAEAAVLTVEYKINFLSPACGDRFYSIGRVKKAGRTLIYTGADVIAVTGGAEKTVASLVATIMTIKDRGLTD